MKNREIKFRGISKKSGHFVYGYYYWYVDSEYIKEVFDIPPTWDEPGGDIKMFNTEVKGEAVGQYTGLKDRNGVEIYEGDWCRAQWRGMNEVKVVQGPIIMDEFMWCLDAGDEIFSINRLHNWEVLGNIHENPELIKTVSA